MEILLVLVPLSLILIGVAVAIYGWAIRSGQYDDLDGPPHSILYDDDLNTDATGNKHNQEASASTTDSGNDRP